jgi:hypothetical protein
LWYNERSDIRWPTTIATIITTTTVVTITVETTTIRDVDLSLQRSRRAIFRERSRLEE